MNILLIHQYYKDTDVTGGARFNEMCRIWKGEGHNITVIAGDINTQAINLKNGTKKRFVSKTVQDGIKVWRCYVAESYNKNFVGRLWAYISFVFSGLYAGFTDNEKYDLILVTSPPLFVGITGYILSKFKKVPYVFEVRDLWPESAIDTGVLKNKSIIRFSYWFERFVYKKASLINVLTPAFFATLVNKKNVPSDKLIMIPNAADFELSDELLVSFDRNAFRIEKGFQHKFVITYVGAHGVANDLTTVLQTAALLRDTNVLFVLVGNGMQKPMLVEEAKRLKLDNVRFFDPVPKREVFKFILASEMGASVLLKNDTFKTVYSNKTFDYMSCKKPILMAIDGISRELVELADAGTYVEPESPMDFSVKIRGYLTNPDLLIKQGENGFKYAKSNFDRKVLAYKYLNYLTDLTSKLNV